MANPMGGSPFQRVDHRHRQKGDEEPLTPLFEEGVGLHTDLPREVTADASSCRIDGGLFEKLNLQEHSYSLPPK